MLTSFSRWVEREARPISLRQLTFFGRLLTDTRLLGSANYVRLELPTRYFTPAKITLHITDSPKGLHIVFATCKHYLTPL
jgi:hypothetical protein